MTKKLKVPSKDKGGKDASKKKSEMEYNDGKKPKSNRGSAEGNGEPLSPKKRTFSAARNRWKVPAKFWDSTMAKLRIQLDSKKLTKPKQLRPLPLQSYCVKRYEKKAQKPEMTFVVAKKVSKDGETELWFPEILNGLKLENGQAVAHSILGSVEEYLAAARRIRHSIEQSRDEASRPGQQQHAPIPQIPTRSKKLPDMEYVFSAKLKEDNSLKVWEDENVRRRQLAKTVSKKSKRDHKDLLMGNHPYKISKGETRQFSSIEDAWKAECRTTKSNGFFKQQEHMGDVERGIHLSLNKTERGEEPEAIIIFSNGSGRPHTDDPNILDLQIHPGMYTDIPNISLEYPNPDLPAIQSEIPFDITEPMIQIGDHILRWSNRQKNVELEMGIMTAPDEAKMGNLTITNIGCCVVRYQLFKLEKHDSFKMLHSPTDTLFVDDSPGIILPAETDNISTIFRSKKAGTFSDKWRIETVPKLANDIILSIWGIAKEEECLEDEGDAIDKELETNARRQFMDTILNDIIGKICRKTLPPPRKSGFPKHMEKDFVKTPISVDLFSYVNPGLTYHSGVVSQIQQIAKVSLPTRNFNQWSLPLKIIRKSMCDLPEEVEFRKEIVPRDQLSNALMTHVQKLSYNVPQPVTCEKYNMCKNLLLDVCNQICESASRIKKVNGITIDMDFEVEIPKDEPRQDNSLKSRRSKSSLKSPSRDGKRKQRQSAKEPPVSPTPPAGNIKFGKIVRGINSAKKSQYKNRVRPIMYAKYLENLHVATYIILRSCIDNLSMFLNDMNGHE